MERNYEQLIELNVGNVKYNEPLKYHTTIKIGGPADILIEPYSIEAIEKIMKVIIKGEIPWTVIGRGSNLLVSDKGIEGVVLKLNKELDHLDIHENQVTVGAGYSLIVLATQLSKKGLKGLEFAGGIPGSVGGAVYMNAGAHGMDLSTILVKAKVLFDDGTISWVTKEEMKYSYRTSVLQKKRPGIVLEAILQLEAGDKHSIQNEMQVNKDYRKETQPWSNPCAGSIFRNPLPEYAGKLIETAGLKGYTIGGAKISELHGNFIVNNGNASAEDVRRLIQYIQQTIYDLYGIRMETEIEIIGRK
ncbi:UDP-N-acetylenolpyruvoylglucosamine reductase [Bacillus coahuilensis p1.1.43]|uniref:UDP-N-acetylenolpyruvoylglucosamine reductase n=1 Tax=Bacillus coahuilensis p1.1.43 TaxID=1150625 RepID=A0A147K9B5_9BACI|nr:UDP-N-acetylmuramate dehydrogenase [Bacillus coahuilensis]KUP07019.1 UDP-N-acetylenolpyruvoylglucosamine reductase [Bacillus coahuilensis p1.1.43]